MARITLPDFKGLKVSAPDYKIVYLTCLTAASDLDAKTLKQHAVRYAREKTTERNAFASLEDFRYTTLGKIAFLETQGFPIAAKTRKWMDAKVEELVADGKRAILEGTNVVPTSPIIVKSDKEMTTDELFKKIIEMVETDKLQKDREAPAKLLAMQGVKEKIALEVKELVNEQHEFFNDAANPKLKKMPRSTVIRRRTEFRRIGMQIDQYVTALKAQQ